jgi:hypothetical protein
MAGGFPPEFYLGGQSRQRRIVMGRCSYCGENAGFLRSYHRACEDRHNQGWEQMLDLSSQVALNPAASDDLMGELGRLQQSSYVDPDGVRRALIEGWQGAVERCLDDHLISEAEQESLSQYQERYALDREELDRNGAYTHLVQGTIIRELTEGKIPDRVKIDGTLPFNFQKSEQLVWVFQRVPYYELRTRRQRVGGYGGVSVRVMKGVYYHTGGFRSRSVEQTDTELVDTGLLGITTKHIYFAGPLKRFRVPYNKVVTFEPYSDGIGIMRDAASARPQTFVTGDGWFVYNLVTNLAQR